MQPLSEKEIIRRIKSGKIDYFAYFVKQYSQVLYYYGKRKIADEHDVADIVQSCFIKAYKGIGHFDEKKQFYPYLFTILKNQITDYYRKKKINIKMMDDCAAYEQS